MMFKVNTPSPHGVAYRILISHLECPFSLKRKSSKWKANLPEYRQKIVKVEQAGRAECVCIKVSAPDSLYVTRDFIVTHNTAFVHGLGLSFLQAANFYFYVDAEYTTPAEWLQSLMGQYANHPGFRADRPRTYEETVDKVREAVETIAEAREAGDLPPETTALVVVDSIRKLVPERLLKKMMKEGAGGAKGSIDGAGGRGAMYKAALNAQWLDELVPLLYHTHTGLVFISREYDQQVDLKKLNEDGGLDYKVGGGKSLRYESSLNSRVTRSWVKEGTGDKARIVGERCQVRITKTKVAAKQDKAESGYFHISNGLLTPAGFDHARDVLELARDAGVVETRGSWLHWANGGQKWQGESKAVVRLTEQPDLMEALELEARGTD
jgi:RecA/RadA recombinase